MNSVQLTLLPFMKSGIQEFCNYFNLYLLPKNHKNLPINYKVLIISHHSEMIGDPCCRMLMAPEGCAYVGIPNRLSSRCRFLLEVLTLAELAFCGTRRFIAMSTRADHWTPSGAIHCQSTPSHTTPHLREGVAFYKTFRIAITASNSRMKNELEKIRKKKWPWHN